MASLQKKKRASGTAWLVQFMLQGVRKSVFLDTNYTEATAKDVKNVVEKCVSAIKTDTPLDARTKSWLDSANDDLKQRFASAGLIKIKRKCTIQEMFDLFMQENRTRFAKNTLAHRYAVFKCFAKAFDTNRLVESLTSSEIFNFFQEIEKRYAQATQSGMVRDLTSLANWAVKKGLIPESPFVGIKRLKETNFDRDRFITRSEYEQVLAACTSQDVRTAFCLYRIGGLRRTEALLLEWSDVDFEAKRLRVHSPKTAKNGKSFRVNTLFAELENELRNQPHNSDRVLIECAADYYYYGILNAVRLAGLERWPRLLQNLRASRAIEINREFGWIPETEWLGHTKSVAQKHYLRATAEDFDKAVAKPIVKSVAQ